jgi:hypothetical protein
VPARIIARTARRPLSDEAKLIERHFGVDATLVQMVFILGVAALLILVRVARAVEGVRAWNRDNAGPTS